MRKKETVKGVYPFWIKTPFGRFYFEATPRGAFCLEFPKRQNKHRASSVAAGLHPSAARIAEKFSKRLTEYFDGKKVSFSDIPIDDTGFTPFQSKVLRRLARLEYGTLQTYGSLAKAVRSPRAGRAVGNVMNQNRLPILLPCHRVVRSDGGLGGYSPGLEWKKKLLRLEGIVEAGLKPAPTMLK